MKKIFLILLFVTPNLLAATFNVATTTEFRQALTDAASNGQDDIIMLADGTYTTTDDGLGTFTFLDTEAYQLTIQGSHRDAVILSGDNLNQVLNLNSIANASFVIESMSVINGYNVGDGGGIYAGKPITINNSAILNNVSDGQGGGLHCHCFSVYSTISNSNFSKNSALYGGGAFIPHSKINNSLFNLNTSLSAGAAFYSLNAVVNNSIFESNSGLNGIFAINNLVFKGSAYINNNDPISISGSTTNLIINSIFTGNLGLDIRGDTSVIANLQNNYLDIANTDIVSFNSNNVFSGIALGFVDSANSNYKLTATSDLIDAGTIDFVLPSTDFDGLARIVGGSVDIGPYEYSTTRPTINTVSYTGLAKEQSELSFSVDYTLEAGRTIVGISYDYMNDGNFVTTNLQTYNAAGTYSVKTKVLDSTGEFSIASKTVVVVELPYVEMTFNQKLIKAIDPIYYDNLIGLIAADKDSAVASASTTGVATGKQYVQNNLAEFSLVTIIDKDSAVASASTTGVATGKQYVQNNLAEFSLVTIIDKDSAVASAVITGQQEVINNPSLFGIDAAAPLVKSTIDSLASGWHGLSATSEITDLTIFVNAKIVWYLDSDTDTWLAYSSNSTTQAAITASGISTVTVIAANSAVWVEK